MSAIGCDTERLERYLLGISEGAEIEATERHLDRCWRCRERIESQAAPSEFWQSIPDRLDTRLDLSCSTAYRACATDESRAIDEVRENYVERWLEQGSDNSILGRVDQYEVEDIIGVGGMGVVLRAFDVSQRRVVAIKTLRQCRSASGEARRRFWRDELDRMNLLADLQSGSHTRYWLERLNTLPPDEIPPEAIESIERIARGSDELSRALAESLLDKNPFRVIGGESDNRNPFVLIEGTAKPALGATEP